MYIKLAEILKYCDKPIKGILHVGAHQCEELPDYLQNGVDNDLILWIEANERIKPNYKDANVIYSVISNKDDEIVTFHVTNNGQSSSILELDEHKREHPWCKEIDQMTLKTKTLNTLFKEHNIPYDRFNMINIDIQGAELLALEGASEIIPFLDVIYLEVNTKHLYKDCALVNEIDAFLKDTYGFDRVKTVMTKHGWGDALYLKNYQGTPETTYIA
jgi:FkbM family methyltransferase